MSNNNPPKNATGVDQNRGDDAGRIFNTPLSERLVATKSLPLKCRWFGHKSELKGEDEAEGVRVATYVCERCQVVSQITTFSTKVEVTT